LQKWQNLRFQYEVQGRLFRNLGDGARIVADDVELEQHGSTGDAFTDGWWFTAGVNVDASNQAEAVQSAAAKVETLFHSMAIVGRGGDLAAAPFLEESGGMEVKPQDGPLQVHWSMPLLYDGVPITPVMLAEMQTKVQTVVNSSLKAGDNVKLALRWYAQAMKRYGAAHTHSELDRFMHLWVALDVLVPLGTGRDPFGNFKGRAQKYLRAQYSSCDPAKVDAILESLYRTRKLIFHEGDLSSGDNERVRLLVRDLIFKELALPSLDPLPATFF
jgi:hypothetical protein